MIAERTRWAGVGPRHFQLSYRHCKRTIDVCVAIIGLIIAFPAMLLIAMAIKLDSPGPIFFQQRRVGSRAVIREGCVQWTTTSFDVLKFRTMAADVDDSLHRAQARAFVRGEIGDSSDGQSSVKILHDPRITRIGEFLRKTSLDELPQLINVIRGEMSLVGPRPVPEYEAEEYPSRYRERFAATPGITGIWQVKGRGKVSFEEMMQMDLEYVRNQSLSLDMRLLIATIPAVLRGSGAE